MTTYFGFMSVRGVSRAVGGIFAVCVLAVSGLFLSGSVVDGQILPEFEPISMAWRKGRRHYLGSRWRRCYTWQLRQRRYLPRDWREHNTRSCSGRFDF